MHRRKLWLLAGVVLAALALTATGSARVNGFVMNESASGDRLLSWNTLYADSIALSLSPDRLTIKEARLVEPGMKIVIDSSSIEITNGTLSVKGSPGSGVRVRHAALQRSTDPGRRHDATIRTW